MWAPEECPHKAYSGRVAAIVVDILLDPGEGMGGVNRVPGVFDLWGQAMIDQYRAKAVFTKMPPDVAVHAFVPIRPPATVNEDKNGCVEGLGRRVNVQRMPGVLAVGQVIEQLYILRLKSSSRR
jgi:hypothetical protein